MWGGWMLLLFTGCIVVFGGGWRLAYRLEGLSTDILHAEHASLVKYEQQRKRLLNSLVALGAGILIGVLWLFRIAQHGR